MSTRAAGFRRMHDRAGGPLVLPNVWDAASARVFAEAGFPALATSSAAVAATLGYPDGGGAPAADMFAAIARIVRAVDVPVTADIEAGYGLAPVELVHRLRDTGAAGCNLEDSDPGGRQRDPGGHADSLAKVRAALDRAGGEIFLNARIDTFLTGDRSVISAIERGRRYVAAGADGVYPILAPPEALPELAQGVDVPLNALWLPDGPSPGRLGELGVTRVTFGGWLHDQATAALAATAHQLRVDTA